MARTLVLLPLTLLLLTACSTGSSVEDAPTVDAADGEVSDGEVSDGEVDADIEVTAPVDPTAMPPGQRRQRPPVTSCTPTWWTPS